MTSPTRRENTLGPSDPRILVVCDDASLFRQLQSVLQKARLAFDCTNSITAACQFAISGRYPVIFTTPFLSDGSWRRLVDISKHRELSVAIILVARSFDISEWGSSMEYGAFDVLDALQEIPKAAEIASRALLARAVKYPNTSPIVVRSVGAS